MVGDGDADAVGGGREIVAGVEQPVAALLAGHPGPFDQMALPVEIVGEHDVGSPTSDSPSAARRWA